MAFLTRGKIFFTFYSSTGAGSFSKDLILTLLSDPTTVVFVRCLCGFPG
jgi:hypothetical protein